MKISFAELVELDIKELFKENNLIIFNDINDSFFDEYTIISNKLGYNSIEFSGSYLELKREVYRKDVSLDKKWIIYYKGVCNLPSEYKYFGTIYKPSIVEILSRKYKVNFSTFTLDNLEIKLRIIKNLWDLLSEEIIENLNEKELVDILLTNGFGYVNLDKEYTIFKYIENPKYYAEMLKKATLEEQFNLFLKDEYGLDVHLLKDSKEIVEYIVLALFQSELIHRSGNKEINPFNIEVINKSKYVNCYNLLQLWSNHQTYRESFIFYSKLISEQYIHVIIKNLKVEEILSLEFFYEVEDLLYKKLQSEMAVGLSNNIVEKEEISKLLNNQYIKEMSEGYLEDEHNFEVLCSNVDDFRAFVDMRKRYYFSRSGLYDKWNIVSDILNIMSLLIKSTDKLSNKFYNFNEIISIYEKQDCWKIDNYYRTIQEEVYNFDILQSKLFNKVNNIYKYKYLKYINEDLGNLINEEYIDRLGIKQQNNFWAEYISNGKDDNKQVVILYVDAMRYEIARQLLTTIEGNYSRKISTMISALPSVTEFGMASMLPNEGNVLNVESYNLHDIDISDGTYKLPLNNKKDRVKYFIQQAGKSGFVGNLATVIDNNNEELEALFRNKKRILIYSTELDEMGHMEDDCIQVFPVLIDKIKITIDKLIQLSIDKIVLTSDHGFLLTNGLEEWQKVDIPKEANVIVKKRRYFISSNRVEGNYITKQGYELNLNSNLYFNFPIGTNVFKSSGGNKFLHGGITIQELLVPVIELNKNEKATPEDKEDINVDIAQLTLDFNEVERKEIVHKTIREEINEYINQEELSKKESAILELFLKGSNYKDSEIVELCSRKHIRFLSESVMTFMNKFIKKLDSQGKKWIKFRVVGNSIYEYFLVEED